MRFSRMPGISIQILADLMDFIHKCPDTLHIHRIPDNTIFLKTGAHDSAIRDGKLISDIGYIHPGISKYGCIRDCLLDHVDDLRGRLDSRRQSRYTDAIWPGIEYC